MMVRDSG